MLPELQKQVENLVELAIDDWCEEKHAHDDHDCHKGPEDTCPVCDTADSLRD